MRANDCTVIEQIASGDESWTASRATAFVAGGSILLWGMVIFLARWLI